jgi:uncharacterized OsmC-like protein
MWVSRNLPTLTPVLPGDAGTGDSGIDVTHHEYDIGFDAQQLGLEGGFNPRNLLLAGACSNAEIGVRG